MKVWNRETGRTGEKIAEEFLAKKGFDVLSRNFSTRFGEIDLIMRDKDTLVFVEVKTKKSLNFGRPEEMFTQGKYERVRRMASVYLKGRDVSCRIDMVAVVLDSNNVPVTVSHYENVTGL